jgi:hypothetical protein
MLPAIVIVAYRRPRCLERLLTSVAGARYPRGGVPLIISLDGPPEPGVIRVAEEIPWTHGPKRVITHSENLGLMRHMFSAGDLADEYKSAILLEEDLLVSCAFYAYAVQALEAFQECDDVAGISLYGYALSENGFLPFQPVEDGSDCYFMQVPSSWGVAFSAAQWKAFRAYRGEHNGLPPYVERWQEPSWKKRCFPYLMHERKYFAYPRQSLSTNFGDPGTHAQSGGLFQVPLLEKEKQFRFLTPERSPSLYDAWFELKAEGLDQMTERLRGISYEVDLYGTKDPEHFRSEYFLTTQTGGRALGSFGLEMAPPVANVVHGVPGSSIRLVRRNDVQHLDAGTAQRGYGPYEWWRVAGLEGRQSVTVAIPGAEVSEEIRHTLDSLSAQGSSISEIMVSGRGPGSDHLAGEYAHLPIVARTAQENDGAFLGMLGSARGDICSWLSPGTTLLPGVLQDVAAQFRRFPEIQWVLGLPLNSEGEQMRSLPLQRWSRSMIDRATDEDLEKSFLPGCLFMRKGLLVKILGDDPGLTLVRFIRRAGSSDKLFTLAQPCAVPAAVVPGNGGNGRRRRTQEIFPGLTGAALRPFFLGDIPFMRFLYYELHHMPDVIRRDAAHGTWYLSRF